VALSFWRQENLGFPSKSLRQAGFMNWAGVFRGIALYAPQHRAMSLCLHRPLLDDIPAEGDPFPQTDKEKHDVDYC
jgi:hypothetical protein